MEQLVFLDVTPCRLLQFVIHDVSKEPFGYIVRLVQEMSLLGLPCVRRKQAFLKFCLRRLYQKWSVDIVASAQIWFGAYTICSRFLLVHIMTLKNWWRESSSSFIARQYPWASCIFPLSSLSSEWILRYASTLGRHLRNTTNAWNCLLRWKFASYACLRMVLKMQRGTWDLEDIPWRRGMGHQLFQNQKQLKNVVVWWHEITESPTNCMWNERR